MRPPTVEVSLPLLGKDYGIEREDRFLIKRHLQYTVSFVVVKCPCSVILRIVIGILRIMMKSHVIVYTITNRQTIIYILILSEKSSFSVEQMTPTITKWRRKNNT